MQIKYTAARLIKQHSETVMVWHYQNADCTFKKITALLIIIFGTLSFPVTHRDVAVPNIKSLRYDTIRDASLTCARTPTWVSLIYRTKSWTRKEGYGGKDLQESKVLSLEWRSEGWWNTTKYEWRSSSHDSLEKSSTTNRQPFELGPTQFGHARLFVSSLSSFRTGNRYITPADRRRPTARALSLPTITQTQ